MNYINSKENKFYKLINSLEKKKNRYSNNLTIFEGIKLIKHCILNKILPEYLVVNENYENSSEIVELFEKIEIESNRKFIFSNKLFLNISDTVNSQGIIGIFSIDYFIKKDINELFMDNFEDNILIIDKIQDPGNLGTIIRNCDAFNLKHIVLLNGSVDPTLPKVIRSTMGSICNINVYINVNFEDIEKLSDIGFKIIPTTAVADVSLNEYKFNINKNAIVLGNESNGIDLRFNKYSKNMVKIEMTGRAESLNVSVASAILLYKLQLN